MILMGMSLKDAQDQYKSGSGAYFSLKNDGDTAVVRFLYDLQPTPIDEVNTDDLDCFVVHEVEIAGKRRVRACTMDTTCPDCADGNKAKLKIFIQLENQANGKLEVWERPSKYASILLGLITRYGPLCNRLYEVERKGAAGDTSTTYMLYALDKDDKTLEDAVERIEIVGSSVVLAAGQEPEAPARPATPNSRATRTASQPATSQVTARTATVPKRSGEFF